MTFVVRRSPLLAALASLLAVCGLPRIEAQSLRREFWTGISGTTVAALVASPEFPDNPTGVDFPTLFEGPVDWADHYGSRLRGYIHPPTTGDYTFWISGDNNSVLYLGTDASPASRRQIALVTDYTSGARQWEEEPGQRSEPIPLEAGLAYYVEALHKEDIGGDHVAVGWQLPDGSLERPIPAARLSPFMISFDPPEIIAQPQDLSLEQGQRAVFLVSAVGAEPLTFQWQRDGVDLPGQNARQLTLDPVSLGDDETLFRCVVRNPLNVVVSRAALLQVRSETVPPTVHESLPTPGARVRSFAQTQVYFTEMVSDVTSDDLLLNGQPAIAATGFGAGPYTFTFEPPPSGPLTLSWAPDQDIRDLALVPNPFPGGSWQLQLDPSADRASLVINEFLASNAGGLTDEEGEAVDWIELHNRGTSTLNLAGWSLSDDPDRPAQWMFPAVNLAAGSYLVVYASGKDRRSTAPGSRLHLNFKLSQTGEPLGLFSPDFPPSLVDGFAEDYPEQRSNIAYGRSSTDAWGYLTQPTPGTVNGSAFLEGVTEEPHFSANRGYYLQAFPIHLSCPNPDAVIRYTTDGSEPTLDHGHSYSEPLQPSGVFVVRAATFALGRLPSKVITQTYLFGRATGGRSLPVLSLVTDSNNLWGATGIMEPGNTIHRGIAWERPISAEWLPVDGSTGFAVDCGIRVQGGDYVRQRYDPAGSPPFNKYSFRLYFRGDYGPSSLRYPIIPDIPVQEFERLSLRAGMNDHSNPFLTDELIRRLHANTGHIASHGTFAYVALNGRIVGYYNPAERIDDDFLRSWTGSTNAWDVIAQNLEIISGDLVEWNRLSSTLLGTDLSLPQNYATAASQLDLDAFIDYLLVNIYTGMGDWPWNNWRAARERTPGAPWRFIIWDGEWGLGLFDRPVTINTIEEELAADAPIANFFRALSVNPDFRLRFADRFHKHFFNNGALTDENILKQYWDLRNRLANTVPGMVNRIHTDWVPNRRGIILQHLAAAGLQASDHAPSLNQHGGSVPPGFLLTLSANAGAIYYTLDDSDPATSHSASTRTLPLVVDASPKRVLVPSTANGGHLLGESWKGGQEPFSDAPWTSGSGGVGYDRNADYHGYFNVDVGTAMDGVQASVYIRVPFDITAADLQGLETLKLLMRFDDGFAAYLNGVRIASVNAPANPAWNEPATTSNPDSAAVTWRLFDVSDSLNVLQPGRNVLALQGLNTSINSSDLLIACELSAEESRKASPSPTAVLYTQPVPLQQSATLKARTWTGDQWSALLEAPFLVDSPGLPLRITEILYHPFGGEAYEFVELSNLSPLPVDLGGMSFDGITYIFPEGAVLTGESRLVLASSLDPLAFRQRYPNVRVYGTYGGSLSNSEERIALLDRQGAVIHAVSYADSPPWPTQADGEGYSLELRDPNADPNAPESWTASTQPGGTPGALPTPPTPPTLRIQEVMTENLDAVEHEGTFPDWIELYNAGENPLALTGWSLSDNSNPGRFVFPAGLAINPHDYLVVWADTNTALSGLHTGFSLKISGETLALYDPQGQRIDAVTSGPQIANTTLGRIQLGEVWTLCQPTPGGPNLPTPTAGPSQLRINEWLAASPSGEDDWFELHNLDTSLPLTLQGLYLTHQGTVFPVRSPVFIAPQGFLVFNADKKAGPTHVDFKLSAAGGTLTVLNPSGSPIDSITFGPQTDGLSQGRLPDGIGTPTSFPNSASPGSPNYLVDSSGLRLNEFLANNQSLTTDAEGRTSDWIELHNPTDQNLILTGLGLAIGSPTRPDWTFPEPLHLAPGAFLLLTCDPNLPASLTPAAVMNTGRGLPREGSTITLLDPTGQIVDQITYGPQLSDRSAGRTSDGWALLEYPTPGFNNGPAQALADPLLLRLNEFMANPTLGDGWFEIHNTNSLPSDMQGLYLTDDPSIGGLTNAPPLPPLSFVGPHAWQTFVADGDPSAGPTHTRFKINPQGEQILLSTGRTVIDAFYFGAQTADLAYGRLPDGTDTLLPFPASPSPGEPNYLPLTNVVINEILAHTDPPFEDAVELLNLSGQTIDIGGWYLSDSPTDLRKYRIPDSTYLGAGKFTVFYELQLNGGQGSRTPFTLNSYLGDAVYLSEADATDTLTSYRSQVHFGPTANGVSLGRHLTSVGTEFAPQIEPSFGVSQPANPAEFRTGSGAPNAGPLIGLIVVREIMATPPRLDEPLSPTDAEFIEIANLSVDPVPLHDPNHPENTWHLDQAVTFAFPNAFTLSAGEEALVVGFDPESDFEKLDAFRRRYDLPSSTRILGPYQGRLADEGDRLELLKPDPPQSSGPDIGLVPYVLVERVQYAPNAPWPTEGIGLGASLQRHPSNLYANDPAHWLAAVPSPGRATLESSVDTDADGLPDSWEIDYGLNPSDATDAAIDPDGDGLSNHAEYLAGTDPTVASSLLQLVLLRDASTGDRHFRFRAVAGVSYTLQYRDAFSAPAWLNLLDFEAGYVGWQVDTPDPLPPHSRRFYRLITPRQP